MTNIGNTPKNNTELWKNHRKWYIFLFLEPQKKITRVKYYPKDQIGWDALIDDPYELAFDAPFEDLEKDIQTEDANPEDADTEDADTEDANTDDADIEDADIEDADIEDADTDDADIEDADIEDADTEDADTEDANRRC